jgi:hypothetical protein
MYMVLEMSHEHEFNGWRRPLWLRRWRRQLSPSPRARPCALSEERLHRELELCLSVKLLTNGEDFVSGSDIFVAHIHCIIWTVELL